MGQLLFPRYLAIIPYMNSSPRESIHYVPEMIPVGGCLGTGGPDAKAKAASLVLPARRAPLEPAASRAVAETGLRIGENPFCREAVDSVGRLEVQRLNRSVVRLEPEAPAAPKVERRPAFHERPKRENGSKYAAGEGQNWGLSQRPSARWIAGAGAAITALVILVMVLLPLINAPNAPRAQTANRVLEVENESKVENAETLEQLLTKQPEAMQVFRAYSQAVHVDEVVPLIRNGAALKETLRSHWHPLGVSTGWTPVAEPSWTVFEAAGHACGLLQGGFPDGSKFSAYFTNDNNRILLDWQATSSFGTASFEQLANNKGDASEIRGQISVADFYSAVWPEEDYQSYRLVSPDEKIAIWCYARRGSTAEVCATSLFHEGEIVQEAQGSRSIALQLERGPSAALPNQWLIGQVLHIDSITP